ncbi:unnamed protein product, partial [Polarella glacialis]
MLCEEIGGDFYVLAFTVEQANFSNAEDFAGLGTPRAQEETFGFCVPRECQADTVGRWLVPLWLWPGMASLARAGIGSTDQEDQLTWLQTQKQLGSAALVGDMFPRPCGTCEAVLNWVWVHHPLKNRGMPLIYSMEKWSSAWPSLSILTWLPLALLSVHAAYWAAAAGRGLMP